jgi:hypothetical protein
MGLFDKIFKSASEPTPAPIQIPEPVPQEEPRNTVKVIDIDGSELVVSVYQTIDSSDRVLIAEGGRTYHTHLSCFKRWTGKAQSNFTEWKIINKSEAIKQGMTYCKFCAEDDNVTLDDLLEELDEFEDEE